MANINIKIDLGHVDLDGLHTEEEIRAAARNLIPDALKQIGEAGAEHMWDATQKAFSGPLFKPNRSTADRRNFIGAAGRKYASGVSVETEKEIEEYIIKQILDQKAEHTG